MPFKGKMKSRVKKPYSRSKTRYKAPYKKPLSKVRRDNVAKNQISILRPHLFTNAPYKAGFSLQTNGVSQFLFATAYRMDSIYDPDFSNLSKNKSCQGYNMMAALYSNYKVYKFTAKVTFINTYSNPVTCSIGCARSDNWSADWSTSKILSSVVSRRGQKSVTLTAAGGSKDRATLTYTCLPRDVLGVSKQNWHGDSQYGAAFGSNPVGVLGATPYFTMCIGDALDSVSQVKCDIYVELKYFVRLFNPIELDDQP